MWSLLAASFSSDPVASHEDAKKLVLFALFYVALDSLRGSRVRERVIDGVLLGGIALSMMTILQYYFMGYDTLEMRPRGLLGHYMTASGLAMSVMIVATARLVFARETDLPVRGAIVPARRWHRRRGDRLDRAAHRSLRRRGRAHLHRVPGRRRGGAGDRNGQTGKDRASARCWPESPCRPRPGR